MDNNNANQAVFFLHATSIVNRFIDVANKFSDVLKQFCSEKGNFKRLSELIEEFQEYVDEEQGITEEQGVTEALFMVL